MPLCIHACVQLTVIELQFTLSTFCFILLILVVYDVIKCNYMSFCTPLKQTGHSRPWYWWEVSVHSAELWLWYWNGLPYLHEAETGPSHWPGLAPGCRSDHVGSAAVQQDPGSYGSLSTGNAQYLPIYNKIQVCLLSTILSMYSILEFFPHQRPRG